MKHLIIGAAFLIGISALCSMPAQAASQDSVVGACTLAASGQLSGQCVGETQVYLDSIKGLPAGERDKAIADLVFKLGQLTQTTSCNVAYDGEVGAAIKLASTYSSSKEQQGQIELISTTVTKCIGGKTASIGGPGGLTPPPPSNTFLGGTSSLSSFSNGNGPKPASL